MKKLESIDEMQDYSASRRFANNEISFVPTMGFLHEGHLSLVRLAREKGETVVVSIFVNPAQFNDAKDLANYPVDMERDCDMLLQEGANAVFIPKREEVFPGGLPEPTIDYPELTGRLCGEFRPGHFQGVLLIVNHLFEWVKPDRAIFGLKDYQQYLLIRKMAAEYHPEVEVIGAPLIREADGLALSSRNVRLETAEARERAVSISRILLKLQEEWQSDRNIKVATLGKMLDDGLRSLKPEYAGVYDQLSLLELPAQKPATRALVATAAWVDGVRLIDNVLLS